MQPRNPLVTEYLNLLTLFNQANPNVLTWRGQVMLLRSEQHCSFTITTVNHESGGQKWLR